VNRFGLRLRRRESRPSCPYCKGEIARGELVTTCTKCRVQHHRDCARELDRCPIMGCGASLVERPAPVPYVPVASSSSGSTWLVGYTILDVALQLIFAVLSILF
jgi:hypothetical protein